MKINVKNLFYLACTCLTVYALDSRERPQDFVRPLPILLDEGTRQNIQHTQDIGVVFRAGEDALVCSQPISGVFPDFALGKSPSSPYILFMYKNEKILEGGTMTDSENPEFVVVYSYNKKTHKSVIFVNNTVHPLIEDVNKDFERLIRGLWTECASHDPARSTMRVRVRIPVPDFALP